MCRIKVNINQTKKQRLKTKLVSYSIIYSIFAQKGNQHEYYILQNTSNTHLAYRAYFCSRHFLYLLYFRGITKITIQAEMIRWQPLSLRPL